MRRWKSCRQHLTPDKGKKRKRERCHRFGVISLSIIMSGRNIGFVSVYACRVHDTFVTMCNRSLGDATVHDQKWTPHVRRRNDSSHSSDQTFKQCSNLLLFLGTSAQQGCATPNHYGGSGGILSYQFMYCSVSLQCWVGCIIWLLWTNMICVCTCNNPGSSANVFFQERGHVDLQLISNSVGHLGILSWTHSNLFYLNISLIIDLFS